MADQPAQQSDGRRIVSGSLGSSKREHAVEEGVPTGLLRRGSRAGLRRKEQES